MVDSEISVTRPHYVKPQFRYQGQLSCFYPRTRLLVRARACMSASWPAHYLCGCCPLDCLDSRCRVLGVAAAFPIRGSLSLSLVCFFPSSSSYIVSPRPRGLSRSCRKVPQRAGRKVGNNGREKKKSSCACRRVLLLAFHVFVGFSLSCSTHVLVLESTDS